MSDEKTTTCEPAASDVLGVVSALPPVPMLKSERAAQINDLVKIIADCGRRFFWCDKKLRYAEIQIDTRGRCRWLDDYTGKIIYLHTTESARWSGFSHGGTLRSLVGAFREYVFNGYRIPAWHFGPWPETFCHGDLWGYGKDNMETIRQAAERLSLLSH